MLDKRAKGSRILHDNKIGGRVIGGWTKVCRMISNRFIGDGR